MGVALKKIEQRPDQPADARIIKLDVDVHLMEWAEAKKGFLEMYIGGGRNGRGTKSH